MGLGQKISKRVKSFFVDKDLDSKINVSVLSSAQSSFLDFYDYIQLYYAYQKCPSVTFCITTKNNCLANGKPYVEDIKTDEESTSKPAIDFLNKVSKPNDYQSYMEFRATVNTFVDIFGWCAIYQDGIIGMNPLSAKNWHVLCPLDLTPIYTDNVTSRLSSKLLGFNAQAKLGINFIPIESCLLIKSNVSNVSNRWFNHSPLLAVTQQVSNCILAYEVRNVSMRDRGAVGALTPKYKNAQDALIPKLKDEIDNTKKAYYSDYGLHSGKSPLIFSNVGLEFTRISWSVEELKLYDEILDDNKAICDALSVPHILSANGSDTAFANQNNGRKSLYDNTIIPIDESFFAELGKWCGLDKLGLKADVDYSDVEILQQSEKDKADAKKATHDAWLPLYEKGLITKNEFLTQIGLPTVKDGDKYISKYEQN